MQVLVRLSRDGMLVLMVILSEIYARCAFKELFSWLANVLTFLF